MSHRGFWRCDNSYTFWPFLPFFFCVSFICFVSLVVHLLANFFFGLFCSSVFLLAFQSMFFCFVFVLFWLNLVCPIEVNFFYSRTWIYLLLSVIFVCEPPTGHWSEVQPQNNIFSCTHAAKSAKCPFVSHATWWNWNAFERWCALIARKRQTRIQRRK